jgi:hypothetical protein
MMRVQPDDKSTTTQWQPISHVNTARRWQYCHNVSSTATNDGSTATTMAALPLMMAAMPHRWQNRHIDDINVILMKVQICDDNTSTRWQHNQTMTIQEHPEQLSRTMKHNHKMTAQLHYDKQSSIDERTTTRWQQAIQWQHNHTMTSQPNHDSSTSGRQHYHTMGAQPHHKTMPLPHWGKKNLAMRAEPHSYS